MAEKILSFKDLLEDDIKHIKEIPEATVKLDVLSEKLGKDVYIKVKGIRNSEYAKLASTYSGDDDSSTYENSMMIILNGVVEPDLHDKDARDRFGARTPKEFAEMIIQGSDVGKVSTKIASLSGLLDKNGNVRDLEGEAKN